MRYEDASHTGAFQGQGPIANDDADQAAAGAKSTATGNVITGDGTQAGSASADSATDGHITAIAGKGGEDSSFSGGKLSVMGEYGQLSVDAKGNYVYQANKGVENVRDRFTYTLADNNGASDTASLIIEIGKTPFAVKADAQQIIVGPDGVVTLPAGVELSDVHVVGRNLVVDMPDGTQLIIVDGAVFVPQLVLGGVEVPATNVAALLIGQEVQPAAGETPPSSGGNFGVPPPPLDPGVPLGDLIPPTEYNYKPPEVKEIGQFEDKKPEAGSVAVQLDDDDVPGKGGNPGGPNDDAGAPNATTSGNLPGSGGDGSLSWDLLNSGAPAGFSYVDGPNGSILVQQVQGGNTVTVLTITINPDTGAYTVTENAPILHAAGDTENNAVFVINYTVTDDDGDVAAGTLTVNVDDDTPTVNVQAGPDANVILTTDDADTDGNPTDSDTASTSANFGGVFSGTTVSFGADGAGPGTSSTYTLAVTGQNSGLTSHGAAINLFVDASGVVIGTTAGSLAAANAGNTIFTVSTTNTGIVTLTQLQQIDHPIAQDPTATGAPFADQVISMVDGLVTLTRAETVVDGDGDQVTGSASVNIGANLHFTDDGPTIGLADRGEPVLNVDETTFGTNDTKSFAENFSASFGADGPANGGGITYNLGVSGANADSGLIDTLSGQHVVLNVVNGQVVGTAGIGGPVVFTVSVDAGGNVTLDQSRAVIHDPDSGPDQTTTLSADNLVTLTATATDFDGDTDSETINIGTNLTFDDDAPTTAAGQVTGVVDEDGVPGGIADGPADVAGEDTTATGSVASLFNSGADQPLSYALAANTVAVLEALNLASGGDALDYEVVGNTVTASTAAGDVFSFTLNANGTWEFELLGQLDHPTLNGQPGDDTENDLAIQLGSIIQATDADGDKVVANADGLVITVDDDTPVARNDVDTVPAGGDIITGNVITGANTDTGVAGADSPGADAPALVIGLSSNNVAGHVDNSSAGGGFIVAGEFGTLTLQTDGSYSYDRNPGSPGSVSDVFTYTYEDADGDKVTATLTININDSAPSLADPDVIHLDDDVIPGAGGNVPDGPNDDNPDVVGQNVVNGQLNGTGGDAPLSYNFTGVDTLPTGFTIGAASDADTLFIVQDQNGSPVTVMTIQLDQSDGSFTVTQNNPILHPTQNGDVVNDNTENNLDFSIGVEVEDADHDVDPATIHINVDDDTPTIDVTKGSDSNVNLTTDDAQTIGGASDNASTSANFGGVFGLNQSAGADGTASAAVLAYSLNVSAPGVNSNLESHNADIFLYKVGDAIVGSTSATAGGINAGNTIFDVTVAADGTVTLTQYQQIDHDTADPTPGGSPFADHVVSLTDSLITLTASASLTDKDGDTVTDSETVNIGANLHFTDDGPDAAVNGGATLDTIVLDETRPEGTDTAGGLPNGLASSTANFADNFAAVTNYGADGAGSTVYSLSLSANGIASGLFALDPNDTTTGDLDGYGQGAPITLSIAGGVITGSANGTPYFTISIDANTGVVTFTQLNPIWHPTAPGNFDETATLSTAAPANVQVVQTVTDFDGDTDSASINVGQGVFSIQDDGPQAIQPDPAALENEAGATVTANLDDDGEVITDFGEDGAGLVQFANIANGADSGLTSGGDPITYWLSDNGQTLEGRVHSTNGTDGELVFSVEINQAGGDYTVTMTGTIDNGAGVSFDDLSGTSAGNLNYVGLGSDDPLTATDVLFSATHNNASSTVNTDSDSIGVANQSFNAGDSLRIDFVSNITSTGGATGFEYDNHVTTHEFLQKVPQVQGNQASTVSFKVWALDTTLTDAGLPDSNPAGAGDGFSDADPVFITSVQVVDYLDPTADPFTLDISALAVGDTVAVHYGISVTRNADGSVTFSGVQEGDSYGVGTGDVNGFDAIVVQDTSGGFDLGVFSIGIVQSGDPIDLSFDLKITDADGDSVALPGAIDVTINPATDDSLAATSFSLMSQEEQSQKQAANSNTLTTAAAVAAAGIADSAAASPPASDQPSDSSDAQVQSTQVVDKVAADDSDDGSSSVASAPETQEADEAPGNSGGHSQGDEHRSAASLDAASNQESSDQGSAHQAANDQGPATAAPQVAAAPAVAMVSAEALQAVADLEGGAKHNGAVEKVIADALGQGHAPSVDALLDAFHGGNGGGQAVANLATANANAVSAWDMASNGASHGGFEMLMKVGAEMLHHDMVPPTHNG